MRSSAIVTFVTGMVVLASMAGCDNVERLAGLTTDSTSSEADGVAADERQVAEILQKAGQRGTLDDALAIAMENDTTVAVEVVSAAKELGGDVADGRSTSEVTQMTPAQLVNEWFRKPAPTRKRSTRFSSRSKSLTVQESSPTVSAPSYNAPVDIRVETKLEKNTSEANAADGGGTASGSSTQPVPGESSGTRPAAEPPAGPSSGPAINAVPDLSPDNRSASAPRRSGAEISDSMQPRRGY